MAKSGVVLSATGSCQSYLVVDEHGWLVPGPKEKGGLYNTISFTAFKHADGTYSGMLLSQTHWGPQGADWLTKVKGKVVHLSIQDNMAKIIFLITEGTMAGQWGVIAFKDLGEGGKSAPPDLQSAWWSTSSTVEKESWETLTPQGYVDWTVTQLNPPLLWFTGWMAIDNGNVQVR